jgi:hypothetical protein
MMLSIVTTLDPLLGDMMPQFMDHSFVISTSRLFTSGVTRYQVLHGTLRSIVYYPCCFGTLYARYDFIATSNPVLVVFLGSLMLLMNFLPFFFKSNFIYISYFLHSLLSQYKPSDTLKK